MTTQRRILFLVLCACLFFHSCQDVFGRRPNIVLFNVDDLGWSDLSYQGSLFYESPNVDALSRAGMVFDNAYACAPNCAPSRACLMSGMYTPRHGVYTVGSAQRGRSADRRLIPVVNETVLADSIVTIPEQLKRAGYRTGHFGKWHLGADPRTQGMDVNIAGREWGSPSGGGYHSPFSFPNCKESKSGVYLTDRISEEAVKFIESSGNKPFFLYLAHYSVHTPLQAKQEYVSRYTGKKPDRGHANAKYAAMIQSMDESLGRVIQTLRQQRVYDDTVIIFISDNGGHSGATNNRPLRGSKGMLYEGGIRVPMIVSWPGITTAGSRCATPVIGVDFMPTLLEIAGLKPKGGQVMDGKSIVPLFSNPNVEWPERSIYWHFPAYLEKSGGAGKGVPFRTTPASAVRRGDWKMIHFYEDGRQELYNLRNDLSEREDLFAKRPEIARQMSEDLVGWVKDTGGFIPTVANPDFRERNP
ncbi:MAG: sulfatase [Planctomycetota bacterium]|nr:sulfatase [Planctomycetota bacterium]